MPRRNKRRQSKSTKLSTRPETYAARAAVERERQELLDVLMRERFGQEPEQEPDDGDD
jgi:hypothetical protein